jgi:hypothetical protein
MITTFWPNASVNSPASTRVTVSVEPPADHGTTMETGPSGCHSACASGALTTMADTAATALKKRYALFMTFPFFN